MLPKDQLALFIKDQTPEHGFEGCLYRAQSHFGLSSAALSLDLPDGAKDLMILWWRDDDRVAMARCLEGGFENLKIREKIATAVHHRLDAIFEGTKSPDGLLSQCLWPSRLPTLLALIWETADQIWRLCGDEALDENHYSKRAIVQMMIFDLWQVRAGQGLEVMNERLNTHIDRVMAFETLKRKLSFSPTQGLIQVFTGMAKLHAKQA
jgi:ubiquinone biosynthesis protein COQ9